MNAIAGFGLCILTDRELLDKVNKQIDELYQLNIIPARHVPARPNDDFDLLVGELLVRYNKLIEKQ